MDIRIPKIKDWEQTGGDMTPGAHGGIIARADGNAIEITEIQPVRAYVGDGEAVEVGFPFWSKEGWYDADDLNPNCKDVRDALSFIGMDLATLEKEYTPEQRAMVIAEALLQSGAGADEGPAGWSEDVVPGPVKWWASDKPAGAEFLSDEDDEFRDLLVENILENARISDYQMESGQVFIDEEDKKVVPKVEEALEEAGWDFETIHDEDGYYVVYAPEE